MDTAPKNIVFSDEVREKISQGVKILATAVKTTLGPKGRNVILDRGHDAPVITKDGITVARSIVLPDRAQELGVRLLREATARTGDTAGDGTTTATVLAEALYIKGLRHIVSGVDPMTLKRGIDKTLPSVMSFIKSASIDVNSPEQICQVGAIAANGERQIGELLGQAFQKVGRDGIILLEEGRGFETEIELIEGIQFDRGYLSPYFATDFGTGEAVYEDVLILLSDKRATARDLIPALTVATQLHKPLLIIIDELSGDALNTLLVNRLKQGLQIVAVKAPGFGDRKKDLLDDFAIATGATLVSERTNVTFTDFKKEHFGHANKIVVKREETIILEGAGDSDKIEERAKYIRKEIEDAGIAGQSVAKEFLEARLAKLVGGIARIKVGGATETEMNERKDRVEDAMYATRAAIQEGFLPGGGLVLLQAARTVTKQLGSLNLSTDEMLGAKVLLEALESPIRQIAINAGVAPDRIVDSLNQIADTKIGYNAATGVTEDLVAAGVIDPTKVVRLALENAVSIAGTMLTTECMVVQIPEEKDKKK
jgi:chaperonin GroEL